MDAIELLTRDHREVEELFDQLSVADHDDQKRRLFERLAQSLGVHAIIERQHFYPAARVQPIADLIEQFAGDHDEVEHLLKLLGRLDTDDDQFDEQVGQLQHRIEVHALEEEARLFPAIRQRLTPALLQELGAQMLAMKEALCRAEPCELLDEEGFGAPL